MKTSADKIRNFAVCCIFLIALLPMIGQIIEKPAQISVFENRRLAVWPDWNAEAGPAALTDYTDGVDAYLNDHFGFRGVLLRANRGYKAFLRLKNPLVIRGRDGWLFLGNAKIWDDFQGRQARSEADIAFWITAAKTMQEDLTPNGVQFVVLVPPNKASIYPEYVPSAKGEISTDRFLERLANHPKVGTINLVDAREALIREKSTGRVYYHTDTHWTRRGAYVAYLEIMAEFNRQSAKDYPVLTRAQLRPDIAFTRDGDLKGFLGDRSIPSETFQEIGMMSKRGYKVETLGPREGKWDYRTRIYSNGATDPTTLVVLGDSFADKLVPPFTHSFDRIVVMYHYLGDFDRDAVKSYTPDAVLFAPVERFASNLKHFVDRQP